MKVTVVGAGIIGLCSADALQKAGIEVTVVDRATPTFGCSYGNGGIIVPSHFEPIATPGMIRAGLRMLLDPKSPFGFAGKPDFAVLAWIWRFLRAATTARVNAAQPLLAGLNLASRDLYRTLISELGCEAGYAEKGLLMICNTDAGMKSEAQVAEEGHKVGLTTIVLNRSELDSLDPSVELASDVKGAVHFQDDAHLTPPNFMNCLRASLVSRGVQFHESERLQLQSCQGAAEVVGYPADQVVLATGVWTGELAKQLGLNLPLLAGKGYGFTVPTTPTSPTIPAILVESRIAVTPMLDGTRFVGTLELGQPTERVNHSRISGMAESIPKYYRGVHLKSVAENPWFGHRPCTPDGLPYIGKPRQFKNLTIAAGHAMMGMSLGPITGKLVAEVVQQLPTSFDLDLLLPDRYAR